MKVEDITNRKITGNTPLIANITSFEPINPFNKSKTTEEALEDECSYSEEKFDIDNNNCKICDNTIREGGYVLQRTDNNEIIYFCSPKCINNFKNNCYPLNEYQLFKISRCASYHCCSELGNLRRMCERTESLTNENLLHGLSRINFCEPAAAGQIQASYAIYKHLQNVDAENEKLSEENTKLNKRTQFLTIISTIMAIFTIVLTGISVAKNFTDKPIEYKEDLDNIRTLLQSELNEINTIKERNENIEELIRDLKNQLLKNILQENFEEE